ncbi:unnamed protein product [Lathyrus sativus]|nr:unnamed protein product [Lathyrus sativus]
MMMVSTVSYRFNVNGHQTKIMAVKRGLRQGDPISPMLFVIVMECLNIYLYKMQEDCDFNYHPKCEKLKITNLCFAEDLLMFSKGDKVSVEMMMKTCVNFSKATGLAVNPQKCRIYCAGMGELTKQDVIEASGFQEGRLPFKYLGVPVTGKKLSVRHYSPLIDKIVGKIKHWTTRLLTYAGRLQLINCVTFALTNYWLTCFPFPKTVIQKIESICRIFPWTGGFEGSRKAPVAWKQVCRQRSHGGLNVIDIDDWNKTTLMKLLWNLNEKEDSLWVKWIQTYYLKTNKLMEVQCKKSDSWIIKSVFNLREEFRNLGNLEDIMVGGKIKMSKMYMKLRERGQPVEWKTLVYGNNAKPRVNFILWLSFHGRLATKDRLLKYGMLDNSTYCFCTREETLNHLFFECESLKNIWEEILR